jgi:Arc/MetJ-type ribon-helix-helix transcriptional regulator
MRRLPLKIAQGLISSPPCRPLLIERSRLSLHVIAKLKRLELTQNHYDEIEKGETAMHLNVPPDLVTLINKRLSGGGYTDAEDVLRRALEAQDAEESWTDEERRALSAHIEEGYQQAERGELIDGAQARREIHAMKDDWRLSKR